MSSKRKQRELALQVLFVWDANADASRELAERVTVEPGGTEVLLTLPSVMPKGRGEPRDDNLPEPNK